jgi:hypothetical protein
VRRRLQTPKKSEPTGLAGVDLVAMDPWDAENPTLTAYGVEVIPSVWLIDPDGKVAARDLTPEELEKTLAAVHR